MTKTRKGRKLHKRFFDEFLKFRACYRRNMSVFGHFVLQNLVLRIKLLKIFNETTTGYVPEIYNFFETLVYSG